MKKLIIFVMFTLLIVLWSEAYADRPSGGSGGIGSHSYVPQGRTVFVPKPDFAELSANKVYQHLLSLGLVDRNSEIFNSNKTYKSVSEIIFTFNGFKAYICEFSDKDRLDGAVEKVLKLNSDGIFNWSMSHKNILFSVDGKLPYINFQDIQKAIDSL